MAIAHALKGMACSACLASLAQGEGSASNNRTLFGRFERSGVPRLCLAVHRYDCWGRRVCNLWKVVLVTFLLHTQPEMDTAWCSPCTVHWYNTRDGRCNTYSHNRTYLSWCHALNICTLAYLHIAHFLWCYMFPSFIAHQLPSDALHGPESVKKYSVFGVLSMAQDIRGDDTEWQVQMTSVPHEVWLATHTTLITSSEWIRMFEG